MDKRVALIAGINFYEHASKLSGCVDDAKAMKEVLAYHEDGKRNFQCHLYTASDEHSAVGRSTLKREIKKLFSADVSTVLFYFAGHGSLTELGGFLLASDSDGADEGISLHELLLLANKSPAKNKLIILDSCHSGVAGDDAHSGQVTAISSGVTVLTASGAKQYSKESGGGGVFTSLLVDALQGGAANLLGDVSPGAAYAHIDQSLGALMQRPVFKANVQEFLSLRRVAPPMPLQEIRQLTRHFMMPEDEYSVDPRYDDDPHGRPEGAPPPDPECVRTFAVFRNYHRLHLLVPVGVRYMYEAAMQSKACRLTPLGRHYWRLVAEELI